jgi:hypothetical protein
MGGTPAVPYLWNVRHAVFNKRVIDLVLMKSNSLLRFQRIRSLRASSCLMLGLASLTVHAQTIQWGLTVTNINNPVAAIVVTNGNGSISITAGGGDTYDFPDSFSYAYIPVSGDFDYRVRVMNVVATEESAKGALMARANLTSGSPNVQINALPVGFGRDGELESIGRLTQDGGTDDLHGTGDKYGGDTLNPGACTYPDLWLRIRRENNRFITYWANTNVTADADQGTNGWNLLTVVPATTNFPANMFIGLSTVAHNADLNSANRVTATYAAFGPTPNPASIPTFQGVAVPLTNAPGPVPKKVMGVNWDVSLPANGLGYPGDIPQASQGAASQIIWNSGGFGSVSRDVLVSIESQSAPGFAVGRYQCGALDFLISPRDPVLAQYNLGPYSNPTRQRFAQGFITNYSSQAYYPTPEEGFVISTVRKNGQQWNDTSPAFYAATYIQLDGVATGRGYSPISGVFRGGHFYTRSTKLITGTPTDPASDLNNLQRCAIPISIAYFPYDQGWKAGYFQNSSGAPGATPPGTPAFKRTDDPDTLIGDGFGAFSGASVTGVTTPLTPAANLLSWIDTSAGASFSGLAQLSLPAVNSQNDGMLFTVSNDEGGSRRGNYANNAPLPNGSGWFVAVRGIEESKSDPTAYVTDGSSSFSFLYVPFNADNLVGARVRGTNGSVIKGSGTFTVNRLSTGRYALSIPGKAGTNGMLLLQNSGYLATQPAGQSNVVDTALLSYEYGGTNSPANAFIIESRYVEPTGGPGGLGQALLRDADFNFVWVDFTNPISPPGTTPPVLKIARSGNNVIISWSNGPGFVLQSSASVSSPSWSNLGTQNPQTIPIAAGPQFFRVVRP